MICVVGGTNIGFSGHNILMFATEYLTITQSYKIVTYFFLASNVVKEFSTRSILYDHEYVGNCINKLIVFYDMRVVEQSEYFDLTFNFLKYILLLNLLFVHDFDCYLVTGEFMLPHYKYKVNHTSKLIYRSVGVCVTFDFSECAVAQVLDEIIVANL